MKNSSHERANGLLNVQMDYLSENLELAQKSPQRLALTGDLIEVLQSPPQEWVKTVQTHPLHIAKGKTLYHSRRDPEREAARQLESLCTENTRHMVCIGAGAGFLPALALSGGQIESLLLVECDLEMIFYTLSLHNWGKFIPSGASLVIAYSPDAASESLEDTLSFFRNKDINTFGVYYHRAAFQATPRAYEALRGQFTEFMQRRSVNQATIIKFQDLWNKNISLNSGEIFAGQTISTLIEQLKAPLAQKKAGRVVICGAGPGLLRLVEDLKEYRGHFLLIAADTAFIPLAKQGIYPDVTIAADPQWVNRHFVLSPDAAQGAWLMDPAVCSSVSHYLAQSGAPLYFWDNPFYLDEMIRQSSGDRGEIAHGGSVTTNAFDLALRLGAREIILAGQDLSFSAGEVHARGAALEDALYRQVNRFHSAEMHNYKQLSALPPIPVPSIDPEETNLFTNEKMSIFIKWFENQARQVKGVKLYNAGKCGVRLSGFEHATFEQIIGEPMHQAGEGPEFVKTLQAQNPNPEAQAAFIEKLQALLKEVRQLKKLYSENLSLAGQVAKTSNPPRHLLEKLHKNDKELLKYQQANQLISLNAQKEILQITESGESSEEALYKALHLGAQKMLSLGKKMERILQRVG